jgi:hypothetical protein
MVVLSARVSSSVGIHALRITCGLLRIDHVPSISRTDLTDRSQTERVKESLTQAMVGSLRRGVTSAIVNVASRMLYSSTWA